MIEQTPGERLRALIELNGYKKKDFALLTDIVPNTLSKILNGHQPLSRAYAAQTAKILNVTPEYLLCESNDPNEKTQYESFLSHNLQWRKINALIQYLKTLKIYAERQLIIDKELYVWKENMFSSPSHPDKEYTELQILDFIKNNGNKSVFQFVRIISGEYSKDIPYTDFLFLMNNFNNVVQSYFFPVIGNFQELPVTIISDSIEKYIQELQNNERSNNGNP